MSDPQRPLIGAADIVNESVDLLRPHQVDGKMMGGGALKHRVERIDMTDMRRNHLLDARCHGKTAEVARTGMRECAHFGFPAMLDERLRERAFVNEQVGIARQSRDPFARRGVAAESDDLPLSFDAKTEAG